MKPIFIAMAILAGATIVGYIFYYRFLRRDHFVDTDHKGCLGICAKKCEEVCLKSPSSHISDDIYDACVKVCKNGVSACVDKCNGCSACD